VADLHGMLLGDPLLNALSFVLIHNISAANTYVNSVTLFAATCFDISLVSTGYWFLT
jgi:hypothetical protein